MGRHNMIFSNFYVKIVWRKCNLKNSYPITLRLGVSARNIYRIFSQYVFLEMTDQ